MTISAGDFYKMYDYASTTEEFKSFRKELDLKGLFSLFGISSLGFSFVLLNLIFSAIVGFFPIVILFYIITSLINSGNFSLPTSILFFLNSPIVLVIIMLSIVFSGAITVIFNTDAFKLKNGNFRINYKGIAITLIRDGLLFTTIIGGLFLGIQYLERWLLYFAYLYCNRISGGRFGEIMKSSQKKSIRNKNTLI